MHPTSAFKSYDVRGQLGAELNADIARAIGRAFARVMQPGSVVTGRDIRDSSEGLQKALHEGLMAEGVDVIDLGLCGTEEVYFATSHFKAGGGLMVTASHNPIDYNGIKMVREGSRPISGADGLGEIRDLACADDFGAAPGGGTLRAENPRAAYADHLMRFVEKGALRPLKVLVNAGNGVAGPTFDVLAERFADAPIEFVRMHHEPDGSFPNGIPNPLLEENQPVTAEAVKATGADLGVAWDGDFDRCFFFDETGAFIAGEYVVALLAGAFLAKTPGAKIVHDPRVIWATIDAIEAGKGEPVCSQSGHNHIKAKMREADAVYGGEMSAHHYFRDFVYCDSGMIPWMLVVELLGRTGEPLSALVADMRAAAPSSGEINFHLKDIDAAIAAFEARYLEGAELNRIDGISADHGTWRVNLRRSNTEPVLRLNVETRGDSALLEEKVSEISALIREAGQSA